MVVTRLHATKKIGRAIVFTALTIAFVGCGGSQPPISAPGAMPQSRVAQQVGRGKSWMLPEASGEDLLYVSAPNAGNVYVYSYPKGQLVGTLTGIHQPIGECTDAAGDVFIVTQGSTSSDSSHVYEYAHGGTIPVAVLNDPGYAVGCTVDPLTGNLAVGNINDAYNPYYPGHGDVAVYADAQGSPTMYYTSDFAGFGFCGYDDSGNLYLEGEVLITQKTELARLAKGGSSLELVEVNKTVYASAMVLPSVQWDGSRMTISSKNPIKGPVLIYRLNISDGKAKVTSTTKLKSKHNRHGGQTWIQGNSIIGVTYAGGQGDVSFWDYPKGGRPTGMIRRIASQLFGLAISPAQQN